MATSPKQSLRCPKMPQPIHTSWGVFRNLPLQSCMALRAQFAWPKPFKPQAPIIIVIKWDPIICTAIQYLNKCKGTIVQEVVSGASWPECRIHNLALVEFRIFRDICADITKTDSKWGCVQHNRCKKADLSV